MTGPRLNRAAGNDVIRIGTWSRAVVPGGQAAVDRCRAATLMWGPWPPAEPGNNHATWLAGHSNCGFGWWANLPLGTEVTLAGPHGDATYVVSGRTWVARKSGSAEGLIHDLTLQTCEGGGTSLVYATRIR